MVRPGARLAFGVHILAAEEVGLNVHLLDAEFACLDLPVQVLMRWIKAACVTDHADKASLSLRLSDGFRIRPGIRKRNFHLNVFSCLHALNCLRRVHLRGRTKNGRINVGLSQCLG